MSFLDLYMEYVEDTEPPLAYHRWTAIACVAACLQRRVWIWLVPDRVYPNLYTILVGPSGISKKGTAMKIGLELLNGINLPLAPTALSGREAFFTLLRQSESQFQNGTGLPVTQHAMTAFAEELQVFLKTQDMNFLGALTGLYDNPNSFRYYTIKREEEAIKNVWFNLLGATAPDWFKTMLPQEAIGGGFTSRCVFVVEDRKLKTVEDPPPLDVTKARILQQELQRICKMVGEMKMSEEAGDAYKAWYKGQEAKWDKEGAFLGANFAGYMGRRALMMRKLSLIFSAMRDSSLEISLADWKGALATLTDVEEKMKGVFSGRGRARYAEMSFAVMKFVAHRRSVKRSIILSHFEEDLDPTALKEIEVKLKQQGLLSVQSKTSEDDPTWKWKSPR